MGLYINQINGLEAPAKGKEMFILKHAPGAQSIEPPTKWVEGLVCVVDNNVFDAAGYAFDESEMNVFLAPDSYGQRHRQWLHVPNAKDYAK